MNTINPEATVQKLSLEGDSLRIQVPFSMSISGPSQSKKFMRKKFEKIERFSDNK